MHHTPQQEGTGMSALELAAQRLEAIAGLLAIYPRPSQDPNGRLLLDAMEMAKASARECRAALEPTR
jgi:hypothetical protein